MKMRKILAIDDQKDNLISIDAILNSQMKDVKVIFALSGKEGINIAKKEKPDCIILDIIMPEMDGYETCTELRKIDETATIPIIMLTAIKTDSDSRIKGLNTGADSFLSKPIDPAELIAVINVMLRIKSAEDKLLADKDLLSEKVNKQTKDLIDSKNKLTALFENAPNPYFSLDESGRFISANKAWSTETGYLLEDIENMKFSNLLPDVSVAKFEEAFQTLKNKGNISDFETTLTSKSGELHYVRLYGSLETDSSGNYATSYWIYQDMCDHHQAKTEVAETNRKFNTLVGNFNGLAYQCYNDKSYTMTYISKGFELLFGYNIDDILHNRELAFVEIIHPNDRENLYNEIQRQLTESESFEVQYRIIDKTGEIHYVIDKGTKIYDPELKTEKLEGLIYDITENIKTGDEINKFISVTEQNPAIIVITDKEGIIEYVNPRFRSVTGYSDEEVIGKNMSFLETENQQTKYEDIFKVIFSGKSWKGELLNHKKDGTTFWERATIFPITDYEGNFSNIIKLSEDITEINKSKEALVESELRYKQLLNTTSEGFWVINKDNITIEVNDALCKMLGYNKDEIIGKSPFWFLDDENKKILEKQIDKRLETDNRKYTITLKTKTGANLQARFNASSIKDVHGNFLGSFTFVTDIRDLMRTQKIQKLLYNISKTITKTNNLNDLIEDIRRELSSIIDTTNFYIALYDKTNNELSLPFFADQRDEVVTIPAGNSLTDYVIQTKEPLLANTETISEIERTTKYRQRGTRSKIWLGVPLILEDEVIGAMVVQSYEDENAYSEKDMELLEFASSQIATSIDKKRKEEEILEALEMATESDKLKTAFLQNISHEIRTPMNSILGFTSLIKDQTPEDDPLTPYIDIIMLSSHRMMNTIQDIMDMSMLEAEQVTLNINKCDCKEALKNVVDSFGLEIKNKNLELELEMPDTLGEFIISTDKDKLAAIVSNLLKNAIKFTSKGKIRVGFTTGPNEVIFHVKDTGIGIQEDRLDAIFEKFVQADISDIKVHEGTGVGLTIAKSYVEKLGGEIWVTSEVGVGSEFYFKLPLTEEESKKVEISKKSRTNALPEKKLKILIVEDEQFTAEYFRIVLNQNYNELLFAGDGETAVEIARKNPELDIILMDIKLPKLDGYSATSAIRTFNNDVIIIAQTAYALAGDNQKAIEAGCNDYITKPINQKKLFELLNKFFG